jgi:hypothetical protein
MKFAEPTKLHRKSGVWPTRRFLLGKVHEVREGHYTGGDRDDREPHKFLGTYESDRRGFAPSYSAHVRSGERGAPVQDRRLHPRLTTPFLSLPIRSDLFRCLERWVRVLLQSPGGKHLGCVYHRLPLGSGDDASR